VRDDTGNRWAAQENVVYDKIVTERFYSSSSEGGGAGAGVLGAGSSGGGVLVLFLADLLKLELLPPVNEH
jgi:hypothetical protein